MPPARGARPFTLALSAVLLLAAGGCAAPGQGTRSGQPGERADHLTVAAAASLQGAFDEIARRFEADNPGIAVSPIIYDGSSTLATQIVEGAPVDVFASANDATMARVADAGLAVAPEPFASNTLVLVVPAGNPGGVTGLSDLASPDLAVVLCASEVPCGAASEALLRNAGVTVTPASFEQNVTAVVTKVAAGEADAGVVYATDAAGRGDVDAIVPSGAGAVVNRYWIAPLADAGAPDAATAFVAYVRGPAGQRILATAGFGSP